VALWGRRGLKESEEFAVQPGSKENTSGPEPNVARETASHAPSQERVETVGDGFSLGLLRSNAYAIIVSFLSIAAPATVWFVGPMWIATYLQAQGLSPSAALWASNASQVVSIAVSLLGGLLTDIYGVGFVNFWAGIVTMVLALPVFALISCFPTNVAIITICLVFVYGGLQGIVDSTIYLYCAEMFPTSQRTRGLSLGYNMGMSIFGGAGPLISQASLGLSWLGPGFHMSASGLVTAVAVASGLLLQRRGKIQLTHVRDEPYFGKAPQAREVPEQSMRQSQGAELTSAGELSV
jgi:MFS family permease